MCVCVFMCVCVCVCVRERERSVFVFPYHLLWGLATTLRQIDVGFLICDVFLLRVVIQTNGEYYIITH